MITFNSETSDQVKIMTVVYVVIEYSASYALDRTLKSPAEMMRQIVQSYV